MNSVTTSASKLCFNLDNILKTVQNIVIIWKNIQPSWLEPDIVKFSSNQFKNWFNDDRWRFFSARTSVSESIRGIYTFHQREFDYAFGLPAFQGLVYKGKNIKNLTRITDLETVSNSEFEISIPIVEWNLNNVCGTWLNRQTFKPEFSPIINSQLNSQNPN